jgi:hypothetical protein
MDDEQRTFMAAVYLHYCPWLIVWLAPSSKDLCVWIILRPCWFFSTPWLIESLWSFEWLFPLDPCVSLIPVCVVLVFWQWKNELISCLHFCIGILEWKNVFICYSYLRGTLDWQPFWLSLPLNDNHWFYIHWVYSQFIFNNFFIYLQSKMDQRILVIISHDCFTYPEIFIILRLCICCAKDGVL